MRAIGLTKPRGAVKAKSSLSARGTIRKAQSRDFQSTSHRWEYVKHKCCDPKDGELCLARLKTGETLLEDCSDSDVQIDRRSWVQRQKTNRTIQQLVPSEVSLRIAGTQLHIPAEFFPSDQICCCCYCKTILSHWTKRRPSTLSTSQASPSVIFGEKKIGNKWVFFWKKHFQIGKAFENTYYTWHV